jgi:dipeptidyl aminopeptidase/acylaminoacyl peptidase
VYWIEGRPDEGGRNVIVSRDASGRMADVTPPGTNVRTRAHEYGGAAYTVWRGTVYYSEFADQRLYRLRPSGVPELVTPPGQWYYADACVDPSGETLVCVREDHSDASAEATTTLVRVRLDGPSGDLGTRCTLIASGRDFYSTPRLSPDGTRLCWLAWDHPAMPWDAAEVWLAEVTLAGTLRDQRRIAGGETESVFQPGWSPDGTLYFASDRSGWWNLDRLHGDVVERVHAMEADVGRPQWQFGMSTWAFADASRIVVNVHQRGRWRLGTIDARTGSFQVVPTDLEPGESIAASGHHAVFVGGSEAAPEAVVRVDINTGSVERMRATTTLDVDPGYLATPEAIEFPTDGGLTAHAFFYRPCNQDFVMPAGERPPLIVTCHGGPTAATSARLSLEVQYWTSRGFAFVDVNYGGSSGYGRAYRQRLVEQWGVVDVADCVNAATYVASRGDVDPARLVIRGRSAGGYTVLAALAFRPDVFSAGASYFGVADLAALAESTHKFESRYLDGLIGPYPAARATYHARSPLHAAGQIRCPVIFFQGLEDRVVPPAQSQAMADAMRAQGVPAELHMFEGEQHGFRKRETLVACLAAELRFYTSVLGMNPPANLSSGSSGIEPCASREPPLQ